MAAMENSFGILSDRKATEKEYRNPRPIEPAGNTGTGNTEMNDTKKITVDDIYSWELQSLGDAIGNCLELNDDFLSRYCGEEIAAQLRRIPESDREYILQSHIGEGYIVNTIPTSSESEIYLPIGEIEYQFDGNPEDTFENPEDFYISGNLACVGAYGAYFPVDVPALRQEIDEYLSSQYVDDIFDDFLQGYLEAAIFTGNYYPDPENWDRSEPLDSAGRSVDDIPREIRKELEKDCADFLNRSAFLIHDRPREAGRDFHFTRNRHGAGFWDGDWEHGNELTDRSHPYGTAELYADDSGIYLQH